MLLRPQATPTDGYNDANPDVYPDWLRVDFSGAKTIEEINVFTLQDSKPSDPTEDMTFTLWGIIDFEVQYWDGSAFVTIPGGSVTGNNKVWRKFTFAPLTTSAIRVNVTKSKSYTRIVELEAMEAPAPGPGNLTASAVSGTQIDLAWIDTTATETGFQVERKTGAGGTYALVASPSANATSYQDTGLSIQTSYYYRVRAMTPGRPTLYSNEANATTLGAVPAPGDLTAAAASPTQVNLTWTDNSGNETGFQIERKLGPTGSYGQVGTVGVNVTSYSDTSASGVNLYYYRVLATSATGNSNYSNEASAITPADSPFSNVYYIHNDHLNTPRAISDSTNTIVWRWESDPFGSTVPDQDPDGNSVAFEYNLRFPGQYFDKETNTHYNYFRDCYDPATGRYCQSDPIGLAGGINTYAYADSVGKLPSGLNTYSYAGGNPLSFSDPEGKWIVGAVGAGVGAITGALGSVAAQLLQNQGNWECVDWKNVGWSALTGGLTGLALTTPLGTTWAGIAGIGAVGNVANYALTSSPQSYSAAGFGIAVISGAAGGAIGGRTPNPYWFIQLSPSLNDLRLAAQLVTAKSFSTNFLGATASGYDYLKGAPSANNCTCSSGR